MTARFGASLCAIALLGASCQSSSSSSTQVADSISPLAAPSSQWLVGTWLQNGSGIGTEATTPLRRGRMQFQVNPPLFQWEGFRTVGVEGDPNFPGPLSCRLRQTSQHFTLKPSTSDKAAPGAQTLTYFVDDLQLIPDPGNNGLCAAYYNRKVEQIQLMRESYFFDIYQDANGQLIDPLRNATFARFAPAKTSDGCIAINDLYASIEDAALGEATGHNYQWSRTSCNQVTITEQTLSQQYDPNAGTVEINSITPGTSSICGQGGDGSCQIATSTPLTLVTHSDAPTDQLRTTTTESVELTPFDDLTVTVVVTDDMGTVLSSTPRTEYLQDPQIPGQD